MITECVRYMYVVVLLHDRFYDVFNYLVGCINNRASALMKLTSGVCG